jgi:hypothetical protein
MCDSIYSELVSSNVALFHIPKQVAKITICGSIMFNITDDMHFVRPTSEQIKNLHDLFCIDVELFDE